MVSKVITILSLLTVPLISYADDCDYYNKINLEAQSFFKNIIDYSDTDLVQEKDYIAGRSTFMLPGVRSKGACKISYIIDHQDGAESGEFECEWKLKSSREANQKVAWKLLSDAASCFGKKIKQNQFYVKVKDNLHYSTLFDETSVTFRARASSP